MNIVVCLDDKNGMLFNNRRQSSDRMLCLRLLERTAGTRLWMNPYSAKLFSQWEHQICTAENFLDVCADEDWCFVENADIIPYIHKVKKVILYRWNRAYPRDQVFPMERFADRWTLICAEEFAGNSHEKITEEVYAL